MIKNAIVGHTDFNLNNHKDCNDQFLAKRPGHPIYSRGGIIVPPPGALRVKVLAKMGRGWQAD